MAYSVSKLGYFSIRINGKELDSGTNIFYQAILQCGYGLTVPVATFEFTDNNNILTGELALIDGTVIEVTLGPSEDELVTYSFRYVSSDEVPIKGGIRQKAYCILDSPEFTTEASMDFVEGTSDQVLSQLASDVGLEFTGPEDTPNDSMVWINSGQTKAQFMQEVTLSSYVSDQEVLTSVVDFGSIEMRGAFEAQSAKPQYTFMFQAEMTKDDVNVIYVQETKPEVRAGIFNAMTNYGHQHLQHSLTGEHFAFETVDPEVLGEGLHINSDVKASMTFSNTSVGDYFDAGGAGLGSSNVYDKYYQASYSNKRMLSLFTSGVRLRTKEFANIPLLTTVKYAHGVSRGQDLKEVERYSGTYFIGGKTLLLQGTHYAEVYDLYRSYISATGNTEVVAGEEQNSGFSPEQDADMPEDLSNSIPTEPKDVKGNKPKVKQPTALDNLKNLNKQVNENVASSKDSIQDAIQSAFDETLEVLNSIADSVTDKFKETGEDWNDPKLEAKHGKESDKFDATMKEFQRAKDMMDVCKPLTELQGLSVSKITLNADKALQSLTDRAATIEGAVAKSNDQIDALNSAADFNPTAASGPTSNIECGPEATKALNDAVKGIFPGKCLDDRDLGLLNLPVLGLLRKLRAIEKMIEDLLCSAMKGSE